MNIMMKRLQSKGHIGFIEFQEFYNTLFKKKTLSINTLAYGHKDIQRWLI